MSEAAELAALRHPLPWQQALWDELFAQQREQRLSHALLLVGGAGIGKRWFARAFIARALCEQPGVVACGSCRSCLQLAAGSHPNASLLSVDGHRGLALSDDGRAEQGLVHWEPDEDRKRREIPIDAARNLIAKLALASHYGGSRYTLIEPADGLNTSSVNAVLKTIEEPPPNTHLLLVTERPQALPATLRSRCQRLRVPRPDAAQARAWMHAAGVRDDEALDYALGAPLRALDLAANDGIGLRRQWAELWQAVAAQKKDPLSAAAAIDKESVAEHLHWAQHWLAGELRSLLVEDASAARREALAQITQDVVEAQRRVAGNANPQLLMESLFIRWVRLARGTARAAA